MASKLWLTHAAPAAMAAALLAAGTAVAVEPTAPLGSPQHPIPRDSPTPPDQAFRLKAGDPTVVCNDPVHDTRANRTRYGGPTSRAGRATKPDGN